MHGSRRVAASLFTQHSLNAHPLGIVHVSRCTALYRTAVCGCLQLKAQFPEPFKAPELAVPPKHTLAALGGAAQHKELLDRWAAAAAGRTAGIPPCRKADRESWHQPDSLAQLVRVWC